MKKTLAFACALAAAASPAWGLNSMTFTITATLTFPSANPNTTPIINGTAPVTATIFIVNPRRESITLMVQANGPNLVSGTDTIPVGNVVWNVTSATWVHSRPPTNAAYWNPEQGPQPLTTSPVTIITGNDGRAPSGVDTVTGTVIHAFTLQNSWLYSTGSYTQTLLWTVTAI
jgi:hypothetical protein